jgi:hypothetical protein
MTEDISPEGETPEKQPKNTQKSPDREKPPTEPREGYFQFQTDIFKHHDKEWNKMMEKLTKEIKQVLKVK